MTVLAISACIPCPPALLLPVLPAAHPAKRHQGTATQSASQQSVNTGAYNHRSALAYSNSAALMPCHQIA